MRGATLHSLTGIAAIGFLGVCVGSCVEEEMAAPKDVIADAFGELPGSLVLAGPGSPVGPTTLAPLIDARPSSSRRVRSIS